MAFWARSEAQPARPAPGCAFGQIPGDVCTTCNKLGPSQRGCAALGALAKGRINPADVRDEEKKQRRERTRLFSQFGALLMTGDGG